MPDVATRRRGPVGFLVTLACLVLVACGSEPTPAPAAGPDLAARSRALLELQVTSDDGPGCIAGVAERGEVRWRGARGLADLESRQPIGDDTTFELASITKGFTGLALLLLVQDGALALDDPVSTHLDGLPSWADRVTLVQLLHHTSGIPDYFPLREGQDRTAVVSRAEVLRRIAGERRLDFAPGSRWAYSNSNYVLLAEVIARTSGQSFPDFLAARVFGPSGVAMVASAGASTPGLARSYEQVNGGYEPGGWGFYALGAVGVRSTVGDLLRFSDDYRTGVVGGRDIVETQWVDAPTTTLSDTESSRYGAGVVRIDDGVLYNEGFFGGYHTGLLVSPDREHSAALLCNRTAGVDPYAFLRGVARVWEFH